MSAGVKEQYWPDVTALEKRIRTAGAAARSVGVVGDVHAMALDIPAGTYIYKPMLDSMGGAVVAMSVVVRTDAEPLSLMPGVREVIKSIDSDLPINDIQSIEDIVADSMSRTNFAIDPTVPIARVQTMERILSDSVARDRFSMWLFTLFAGIALALASVGIYGVTSYSISQRTAEMGIRMVVGATAQDVVRLVMLNGAKLALGGVVVGLLGAAALSRVMASQLYTVGATDPATFGGVALVLALVALASTYIPALRAARIDPVLATQGEGQ